MTQAASPTSDDRWAFFLDFDGTLVDIALTPGGVVVDSRLPSLLDSLRRSCGGALAIVTGRSIATIEGFLPDLGLDVCGLHGMERRLAGTTARIVPEGLDRLRAVVPSLVEALAATAGILVEDKGESVALHWRLNPDAAPLVLEAAEKAVAEIGPTYRLQPGKAVAEIVPRESGKGRAIEALLELAPYRGRRALFAGDDVTDESGFEAVNAAGGLSLKIGPGETTASHRLASPEALRVWLEPLAGNAGRTGFGDLTQHLGRA